MTTKTDTARQQAEAQLEHIRQLMAWHEHAYDFTSTLLYTEYPCGEDNESGVCVMQMPAATERSADPHDVDAAQQAINEKPLSVEVRGAFVTPDVFFGNSKAFRAIPVEYSILLCTGGPAVRIVGELDGYGNPETARLEYQDWGTPWTEYTDHDYELLEFTRQFYFGS
jgi:hypothetical protein